MKFISNQWAVASGSINGTTYSKNRVASYTRNRSKPVNRQSGYQTSVRMLLAAVASSWRGLTQAQRNLWNAFAANFSYSNGVDGTYVPTGFQMFNTVNQNSIMLGSGAQDTPPSLADASLLVSPLAASVNVAAFELVAEMDPAINGLVFVTPPVSSGKAAGSVKSKFVLLRSTPLSVTPNAPYYMNLNGAPVDIKPEYMSQFGIDLAGALPNNANIFFKVVPIKSDFTALPPMITSYPGI